MTFSVRAIVSKLISPACTPLAVVVAFIGGNLAGVLSGPPLVIASVGLGIGYSVVRDTLRWALHRRRGHA